MICFSFSDLQRISSLSGMTEIDMLDIKHDKEILSYLHVFGMDIDYPVLYVPNLHRNLSGKVLLGFRAVGEVRCDPEFAMSSMASMEDKIAISAYTDTSLTIDLATLSCMGGDTPYYESEISGTFPADAEEPDSDDVGKEIARLEAVRDSIRGSCYLPNGALKDYQDYQDYYKKEIKCRTKK